MLRQPVTDDDWVLGPAEAAVTLVEYADFQCPHCQRAHPVVERILGRFGARPGARLRFVFRHLPITSIHPQAMAAALAAEAAGRQGKFWEMERRLMEAKGALAPEQLERYAQEIGLDVQRWKRDIADPALTDRVNHQKLMGVRSGANGTPTFFINGERFDGDPDTDLAQAIADALQPA
jgi:protein-disulfide isomerase